MYPLERRLSLEDLIHKKHDLSATNSSIFVMSSSEYLFLEPEFSFTKYASLWDKTKYLRLPFLKMKEFRIILASLVFSVFGGVWLYKLWEIYND